MPLALPVLWARQTKGPHLANKGDEMSIRTSSRLTNRQNTRQPRDLRFAVVILAWFLCLDRALPAESGPDRRPTLHVPVTESKPVLDGKLDEPCWGAAARTGPLEVAGQRSAKSTTEAFILHDADHLYVGVSCGVTDEADGEVKPGDSSKGAECIELFIDSNGDGNSYYVIRITPEDGGNVTSSYNELDPPWHDRTWQPPFEFATARGTAGWAAEVALPLDVLNKNKNL